MAAVLGSRINSILEGFPMVKLILRGLCLTLLGSVAAASAATTEVVPKPLPVPKITSVSKIGTTRLQTITIKGTGFGTFAGCSSCDSPFIWLRELHPGCPHGGVCWEAGYSPDVDTVTLIIKKWTNTEIVLGGFGTAWGRQDWTLHKGYVEQIRVWNWQSTPKASNSAAKEVTIQ
jgi:hypothetical protein